MNSYIIAVAFLCVPLLLAVALYALRDDGDSDVQVSSDALSALLMIVTFAMMAVLALDNIGWGVGKSLAFIILPTAGFAFSRFSRHDTQPLMVAAGMLPVAGLLLFPLTNWMAGWLAPVLVVVLYFAVYPFIVRSAQTDQHEPEVSATNTNEWDMDNDWEMDEELKSKMDEHMREWEEGAVG